MIKHELVVIGGGPAGLSAAYEAWINGIKDVLIIERDNELGGILNQCIHNGFGLHRFKEELTGPEYAQKYLEMIKTTNILIKSNTMVIHLGANKEMHLVNSVEGYQIIEAKSIILAMGCRERCRGAISLAGDRGSGILTAGACQKYVNMLGYLPGKKIVILGSGDIGLIMARRMTLEGAKVLGVVEIMPHSSGLRRNIVQCLDDYEIPLYLSHTITNIIGDRRVEKVEISKVDDKKEIIKGSEFYLTCDTVLLSVGLIPENELTKEALIEIDPKTSGPVVYDNMETTVEGIFACGNVLHVHDLVDYVSLESAKAGFFAAKYLQDQEKEKGRIIEILNGEFVSYTVPQRIRLDNSDEDILIYFRVPKVMLNALVILRNDDKNLVVLKKIALVPGEMESVKIAKNLLLDSSNLYLEVRSNE